MAKEIVIGKNGPDERGRGERRNDRGQTGIDFVVGMAVFLLAVAFVFAFVPSMFDPFFGTGTSNALIADRSAAYLVENELAEDPAKPAILDEEKVELVINQSDCSSEDIGAVLGIDTKNVQVDISNSDGIAYGPCGDDPPPGESVTVSRRIVSVDGNQSTLRVRVW